MMDFIANNYGSIIVGAVLLAIVAAAAVKIIRDRKKGKGSCSCGCDGCPNADTCHDRKEK